VIGRFASYVTLAVITNWVDNATPLDEGVTLSAPICGGKLIVRVNDAYAGWNWDGSLTYTVIVKVLAELTKVENNSRIVKLNVVYAKFLVANT
jgi:hypothetical protein